MSRSSKWWKVWTQSTARSSCGNEGRLSSARKLSRGLKTEKQSLPLQAPVELWLPSEQHFTLSRSSLLSHALLCSVWCDFKSEFLRIHLDQLAIWSRWDMTEYWLVAVVPEQWVETAAQLGNTGVARLDEKKLSSELNLWQGSDACDCYIHTLLLKLCFSKRGLHRE